MCDTIFITETETTDTGVILIPREAITPGNLSGGRLILACNINTPTANQPLFIQTTAGNCPVLCKFGNNILANMINKRVPYPILFGNENSSYEDGQFVIPSCANLNRRGTVTTPPTP